MMYGINPRMLTSDTVALLTDAGPHHRILEMFGESGMCAAAAEKSVKPRKSTRKVKNFGVRDEALVAHGLAFNNTPNRPRLKCSSTVRAV